MAPFNWFKRQFSEQSASESTPAEEQDTSSQAEEQQAEEPATQAESAPPAVSQDQLAWAKAAYENIRKRQASAEPSEAPATEASVAEAIAEPAAESIAPLVEAPAEVTPEVAAPEVAAPEIAKPEAVEPEAVVEPAIIAPEIPAPEAIEPEVAAPEVAAPEVAAPEAIETPSVPETPVESVPEAPAATTHEAPVEEETTDSITAEASAPPTAVPFWMQAETERLERLERLKAEAEAAAIAEAPAITETAPSQPDFLPDFVLDEGFLWSAEVLAAQGRRPEDVSIEEITWLKQLRQGLDKTRRNLVNQLKAIVGQGPLNQDAVMEIESLLLQADVGIEATDYIINALQQKLREEALPPNEAIAYLKRILREMLDKPLGGTQSISFVPEKETLNVWLITGVNGAGKTTTIGKLAHIASKSGYRCLIGAADTFRAAAVQQVKVWGERSNVEVIANPGKNTDPAAVVFDAISAAQSRQTELLLVDTAGRLQNKKNLMDELSKIRRIIDKKAPDAKIESLLVLDATLGQNGLRQAEIFSEVAKLSGVVLTKLDGTAKGGIALAVVQQLGLPIRFIGAGEGIEDLRPFSSYEFVEALLDG